MISDVERQYDYKSSAGMLGLLGVLSIILGPLVAYISTIEPTEMEFDFITLTPHQSVWFMGAVGIVILVIGGKLLSHSRNLAKVRPRIAFTSDALLFVDPLFGGDEKAVLYTEITDVAITKIKNQRLLHFTYPGGSVALGPELFKSKRALDEISTLLMEKVQINAVVKVPEARVIAENSEAANIQELKGGG